MKIGITGTIASGKTSLSIILKRRGYSVFNCDQYARSATNRGNICFDSIVHTFGEGILCDNGDIDRKKLADIVFKDEEERKKLNAIVHPYVIAGMKRFFANHENEIAFAEVPLLFEAGLEDYFDEVCVITCSKETAVRRMMEDRDYTEAEALARYESQIPPEEQIAKADKVLYNDGTLRELNTEVNLWVRHLRERIRNGSEG
ncbi:MAG: dephospho-CoA kinase [Solobacterium sp.]|nr:dephospho-CoA kinase [Solobacterium sp.]